MSASIIQLVPRANPAIPETMVTVSITRAGDYLKSKCPQSRETAGIEHLIETVIGGFRIHAIERHALTGPESFRVFSDVLKGDALLKWQTLMAGHYAVLARRTPAGFIRAQKALIVKMEGSQVGNHLLSYLSKDGECMKPYKMKPIAFRQRFEQLRQLLTWFDTWEVAMPDNNQWKSIYVKKFYHKHAMEFNKLKDSIHDIRLATVTIQTITEFMQNLWDMENPTQVGRTEAEEVEAGTTRATNVPRSGGNRGGKKRNGNQRRSHSNDSHDSADPDGNHSNKRTRRGKRGGQKNNNSNKSSRQGGGGRDPIKPDDLCPIHNQSFHKWSQCHDNPANRRNNQGRGNGGRGNGQGQGQGGNRNNNQGRGNQGGNQGQAQGRGHGNNYHNDEQPPQQGTAARAVEQHHIVDIADESGGQASIVEEPQEGWERYAARQYH